MTQVICINNNLKSRGKDRLQQNKNIATSKIFRNSNNFGLTAFTVVVFSICVTEKRLILNWHSTELVPLTFTTFKKKIINSMSECSWWWTVKDEFLLRFHSQYLHSWWFPQKEKQYSPCVFSDHIRHTFNNFFVTLVLFHYCDSILAGCLSHDLWLHLACIS